MIEVLTLAESPDLMTFFETLNDQVWPQFILHASTDGNWWSAIEMFPAFQFALVEGGTPIACGHMVPFAWSGELDDLPVRGWDGVIQQGLADHAAGKPVNAVSALAAMILPTMQGRGLSKQIILTMKEIAKRQGIARMVAPVRPTWKARYPLTPMQDYITWTRADGQPFDPWIRVHLAIDGRILRVAHQSMTMWGTVADWEAWSGLEFPASGRFVVEGALSPIEIDKPNDHGLYIEPNVWIEHPLS